MVDQDRLRRLQRRVYGPTSDLDAAAELRELLHPREARDGETARRSAIAGRGPVAGSRRSLIVAITLVLGLLLLVPLTALIAPSVQNGVALSCPTGWTCHRSGEVVIAKPLRSAASTQHLPQGAEIVVDTSTGYPLSATWALTTNAPHLPGTVTRP